MLPIILAATAIAVPAGAGTVSITLQLNDQPLESAFRMLMAQTDYNFIYEPSLLADRRVSVDLRDVSLEKALETLFDSSAIKWTIQGHNVMLRRGQSENVTKEAAPRKTVISGFVREALTGEAIIGAIVSVPALRLSSSTNSSGYYAIELPADKQVQLSVNYPGMESVTTKLLTTDAVRRMDFDLNGSLLLDEVSVIADAPGGSGVESASIGHINISSKKISSTPVMFGEPDVIKSLQLQPGVSAGMEGLSGMYVHGGDNDQNMIMLDNVPLYQVSHLGGLFSAINTRAIKNVDFYKSSFPARYNGRLSSVIEINTKDGSLTSHHGSATLGMTSGSFNIDGPVRHGRTSYSVALRRTWLDVLTTPALAIVNRIQKKDGDKTIFGYNFTDLNGKINHNFNDRSRMYLSLYWGEDYLKGGFEENYSQFFETLYDEYKQVARLRWGNFVASAGWTWQASDRLYATLTGSFTKYRAAVSSDITEKFGETDIEIYSHSKTDSRNTITDWSVRSDFEWVPSQAHHTGFGATFTLHRFIPRDETSTIVSHDSTVKNSSAYDAISASELSAYIGDDWRISSALRADYGVNMSMFAIGGRTHGAIDPRASLRWMINDGLSLKGAYSCMSQYVHQLTTSAISLPTDKWVPIDGSQHPERSEKISLGINARLPWWGLSCSAEIYYKWMHNIADMRDDYYLSPANGPWYNRVCEGEGKARGLDFMIERKAGNITGQVAYSLLWSDRRFDNRNGGEWYPARYDNRHKINILVNWRINDRWSVNAAWTGMSGNRFTLSTQDYFILEAPDMPYLGEGDNLDLPGKRNGYRLPFYHRLDFSAIRYTRRGFWTFSIFNAYCNLNTITIRKDRNVWMDDHPTFKRVKLIPLIPSVSYTWNF